MALKIDAHGEATLKVQGLDDGLESVYARLDVTCPVTGTEVIVKFEIYESKTKFDLQADALNIIFHESISSSPVTAQRNHWGFVLEEGELQSVQIAHNKMQALLESAGYRVTQQDLD